MHSLVEQIPTAAYVDGRVSVSWGNGVTVAFPIAGNWRLEDATPEQLRNIEVDDEGLHWPELDEDLSFEGLLTGDYGQFIVRKNFFEKPAGDLAAPCV